MKNSISETLSYNTLRRLSYLMNERVVEKETIEALFTKLLKIHTSEILFLFPGTGPNAQGESIFETIMRSNE